MKALIEKLPLAENTSFLAKTFRTPHFEVPWHQHEEYELILFTEGDGLSFIGNYAGEFKTGDVFFIGKNVPHTFQKREEDMITSAVVVQFREDFWGSEFLNLPEASELRALFLASMQGLQVRGITRQRLGQLVVELEQSNGFARITKLMECLRVLQEDKEYTSLSTRDEMHSQPRDMEKIDRVFRYTIQSFRQQISLADVAEVAGMSVQAFCNYFKKSTKKTYIDFLNEIRIGYACKLLINTDQNIINICFDSGYNTLANFNKQFLKIKQTTPSKYRKVFATGASAGNVLPVDDTGRSLS